MAHAALHFSLGMTVAAAATLPHLIHAVRSGVGVASSFRNWVFWSYATGVFGIAPSLLRAIGCPAFFCEGWWMNVFLLHPLLSGMKAGGTIAGPAVLGFCFAAQYATALAILRRQILRRRQKPSPSQ